MNHDLLRQFCTRAVNLGAEIVRWQGEKAAQDWIVGFLAQSGEPGTVAVAPLTLMDRQSLQSGLQQAGWQIAGSTPVEIAAARLGITEARWGIARTGTICQLETDLNTGYTSLLPPIHLAILHARQILPDLDGLWALVDNHIPRLRLISGPSKTSDIERVLTVGVHGPRQLLVGVLKEGCGLHD